ncbi:MAG: hypothetical protein RL434_1446 [Pseudomonadota bacterium]
MATVQLQVLFGLRVRELREAAGISQEAFANKHGFARSYMSKIERGKANVALDGISRLAEALGVEPKVLFEASSRAGLATQRERQVQVPFAADGTFFNPSLRQRTAGTFAVGPKDDRRTFDDFEDALAFLKTMDPPKWWRPNSKGHQGLVRGVRWGLLPD